MTDEQRQWAIRRIQAKRSFWVHLAVYVAVNALLVLIWSVTSGEYFWPVWPMLGWGIGLAAHAVTVYVGPSKISEAQIDRELQGRRGSWQAPGRDRRGNGRAGRGHRRRALGRGRTGYGT